MIVDKGTQHNGYVVTIEIKGESDESIFNNNSFL